jgi:hypothetical protein
MTERSSKPRQVTRSQNQLIDDSGQRHLSNVSTMMASAEPTTSARFPMFQGTVDLAAIEWSYLDTQGVVQGEQMQFPGRLDF